MGVDGGLLYYPLSMTGRSEARTAEVSISVEEKWRPYLGVYFVDRQFISSLQKSSATFLGPGVGGGTEFTFRPPWNLKGEIRYLKLSGQSGKSSTILEVLLGVVFQL